MCIFFKKKSMPYFQSSHSQCWNRIPIMKYHKWIYVTLKQPNSFLALNDHTVVVACVFRYKRSVRWGSNTSCIWWSGFTKPYATRKVPLDSCFMPKDSVVLNGFRFSSSNTKMEEEGFWNILTNALLHGSLSVRRSDNLLVQISTNYAPFHVMKSAPNLSLKQGVLC